MAYNAQTVQRIRDFFQQKEVDFYEQNMFNGVCFMVDGKMCCGSHLDKKTGEDYLMCRIGEDAYQDALQNEHVIPMEFTGKAMKGYIYVTEDGLKPIKSLHYWLQLCLDYNPQAKASKKKNNKK
jgi:hypothetical protein